VKKFISAACTIISVVVSIVLLGCPVSDETAIIYIHQDGTEIVLGSGSFDFGDVFSDGNGGITSAEITFTIENSVSADGVGTFVISGSAKTGALTYTGGYSNTTIDTPYAVAVSPEGNNVYVAAADANAVAWFTRD